MAERNTDGESYTKNQSQLRQAKEKDLLLSCEHLLPARQNRFGSVSPSLLAHHRLTGTAVIGTLSLLHTWQRGVLT